MARYYLSGPARDDILEILSYLRERSPRGARNVRREMREAMKLIADMPGIGHRRDDLGSEALRCWAVRSYLIIYRPEPKPLAVVRVLHGARNIGAIMVHK